MNKKFALLPAGHLACFVRSHQPRLVVCFGRYYWFEKGGGS